MKIHNQRVEPWNVTLVDTGEETMTGGRLKRVKQYLKDEELFQLKGKLVSELISPDLGMRKGLNVYLDLALHDLMAVSYTHLTLPTSDQV